MRHGKDSRNSWYDWARERTDPAHAPQKPEALSDLLVLDVSAGNMGGPVCSSMLAELGAQVIRIEPPGGDVDQEIRAPSAPGIKIPAWGISWKEETNTISPWI